MLKQVDKDWPYDYDFIQDDDGGASIWVAGPDGKPWINVVLYITDIGVMVSLWPMIERNGGIDNLTHNPVGTIHLDFAEVESLRGGQHAGDHS